MYNVAIVGATGKTGSAVEHYAKRNSHVNLVAKTSRQKLEGYRTLNIDDEEQLKSFLSLEPKLSLITIDEEPAVKQYVEKFREIAPEMDIVDLSPVYRTHPDFLYGLPEIPGRRNEIIAAKLISNPGCYSTSAILSSAPVVNKYSDDIEIITVVGESSHTGVGKKAENELRSKYENNILSYSSIGHKHIPEMKRELGKLAGRDIRLAFGPSAVWCPPGILNTIFIHTRGREFTTEQLKDLYSEWYKGERFVRIVDKEPSVMDVRGTNYVDIFPQWDSTAKIIIVRSVIDNMVKGAAGQAIQNMNLMLGLNESEGLL
jgi:N-acetyl-gamma-glutamyl-phosphate reductase